MILATISANVFKPAIEKHKQLQKISKGKKNDWISCIYFIKKAFKF